METTVALVGGTGAEGSGLAVRFALAGVRVRIGSRELEKAQGAARRIAEKARTQVVTGHTNQDAVAAAGIVIITVPITAHMKTLESIQDSMESGAILVDATVPLEVAIGGRLSRNLTLWDGSAAQQAARLVTRVPVVAAFHSLSADSLWNIARPLECDTLICGDSAEAKKAVMDLAAMIPGVRSIDAGPLENARLLESTAALLISLNLRHHCRESGMRITGLPNQGKL